LPVERLVVKDDQLIRLTTFRNKFSFGFTVDKRRDAAPLNLNCELVVLQNENTLADLLDGNGLAGCDLERLDVYHITPATGDAALCVRDLDDFLSGPGKRVQRYKISGTPRMCFRNTKGVVKLFEYLMAPLEDFGVQL
jgi:hypothetical protein